MKVLARTLTSGTLGVQDQGTDAAKVGGRNAQHPFLVMRPWLQDNPPLLGTSVSPTACQARAPALLFTCLDESFSKHVLRRV